MVIGRWRARYTLSILITAWFLGSLSGYFILTAQAGERLGLVLNPKHLSGLMIAWLFASWRVGARGAGSMPSGLLINGLVSLIIGLAALIVDIAFKYYMGFIGYVIIAILSAIIIIIGITRIARALGMRGAVRQ